jgi:hypothetical protein
MKTLSHKQAMRRGLHVLARDICYTHTIVPDSTAVFFKLLHKIRENLFFKEFMVSSEDFARKVVSAEKGILNFANLRLFL